MKNEKTAQYDRMALLFILLNLGFLVYITFTTESFFTRVTCFSGSVFVALLLALRYFLPGEKKKNRSLMLLTAGLIICFSWMTLQHWWLMVLSLAILVLYIISKRKMFVMVMKEHIIYPSFPEKKISWPELSTVILRDGLLTLNFRTNRFIQQPLDESGSSVNEPEFNEFCRQQLSE